MDCKDIRLNIKIYLRDHSPCLPGTKYRIINPQTNGGFPGANISNFPQIHPSEHFLSPFPQFPWNINWEEVSFIINVD